MKAKEMKQKVVEKLAKSDCVSSMVRAGFSSIYACRDDSRP